MSGIKAYHRETYLEDIRTLQARGLTLTQIATHLGISRATVCRILRETRR